MHPEVPVLFQLFGQCRKIADPFPVYTPDYNPVPAIIILRRLRHQILRRIPVLLYLFCICQLVINTGCFRHLYIIIAVHDSVIRQNRSRICLSGKCHRKAVHTRRRLLIALLLLHRDTVHAADRFFSTSPAPVFHLHRVYTSPDGSSPDPGGCQSPQSAALHPSPPPVYLASLL